MFRLFTAASLMLAGLFGGEVVKDKIDDLTFDSRVSNCLKKVSDVTDDKKILTMAEIDCRKSLK